MKRKLAVLALLLVAACAGVLGLRRTHDKTFPHRAHVVAAVTCTRCHTDVDKGQGLHLPTDETCTSSSCHVKPHDTRSCMDCHTPTGAITALAEAKDHLIFDHGKHLGDATKGNCMRCHVGVADGDTQMRPTMASCFKCHDASPRKCNACHRDLVEDATLPQSHLAHDGDWLREHGTRAASSGDLCQTCHKESYCASCHGKTVAALPSARRFADPLTTSVHRAGFVARHSLEARSEPGACTSCHAPDRCITCHSERGVGAVAAGGRSPHPAGWLGLSSAENAHGREARRDPASCASCHGGAGEQLCVSCHAVGGVGGNPHPPGWSSRQPLTAMPCRMCHPTGAR